MYSLQAVIVTESARGELLDSTRGARLVVLGRHRDTDDWLLA
ncbi:hypothetical protein [Amycolatopsis sp. NPDC052450]